jgi:hypothetical protein
VVRGSTAFRHAGDAEDRHAHERDRLPDESRPRARRARPLRGCRAAARQAGRRKREARGPARPGSPAWGSSACSIGARAARRSAEKALRQVRAETAGVDAIEEESATLELVRAPARVRVARTRRRPCSTPCSRPRAARACPPSTAAAPCSSKAALARIGGRNAEALAAARAGERTLRTGTSAPSIYWLDAWSSLHARSAPPAGRTARWRRSRMRRREWERWRAKISSLEWRERAWVGALGTLRRVRARAARSPAQGGEATRARQAFDALQAFQARTLEERMHGAGPRRPVDGRARQRADSCAGACCGRARRCLTSSARRTRHSPSW